MFQFGLEVLLSNKAAIKELRSRKVGLVAHPASVNQNLDHSLDLLANQLESSLKCAFGPQHGLRGDKQDNMIESDDFLDPRLNIPIHSLYGEVRRPTAEMLKDVDVLLFDLQDLGCRIYTFLTTLFYCMEDCAKAGKSVWVLDRPNPIGRPVEGNLLQKDFFSFVGAAEMPMRHGLTLGEAARWYRQKRGLDLDLKIIAMKGYAPSMAEGCWPQLPWINPSPNAPNINMARVYPGSVILEGTNYSEGRGTTRPLEMIGAPHIEPDRLIKKTIKVMGSEPKGCLFRPCFFEPTFHKFKGELCGAIQIHCDTERYDHGNFKPYRLFASLLKAAHELHPDFKIWSEPPYEYVEDQKPFDVITGSEFFRNWVEDPQASAQDLENYLSSDEKAWTEAVRPSLLY